jgi:hypothetical protein
VKKKQMIQIFDSACRKVKKAFQAETVDLRIVKSSQLPGLDDFDGIAGCRARPNLQNFTIQGWVFLMPEIVSQNTIGWNSNEIELAVQQVAVHEVSHHLVNVRLLRRLRNQLLHREEWERRKLWKAYWNEDTWHGSEWWTVMDIEMGAVPDPYFCKVENTPTILLGGV